MDSYPDRPVDDLESSIRGAIALQNAGIVYIGELADQESAAERGLAFPSDLPERRRSDCRAITSTIR